MTYLEPGKTYELSALFPDLFGEYATPASVITSSPRGRKTAVSSKLLFAIVSVAILGAAIVTLMPSGHREWSAWTLNSALLPNVSTSTS